MIATIGYSSLLLALVLAGWGIAAPLLGARTGREAFFTSARGAILGQFACVTLASLALIYALVTTDFSLKYVALHTTRATPIYYRVTGLWGALEGSLLLWEWLLIIFSGLLAWIYRDRHRELMPWVLLIFSGVSAFFLSVMAFASNPFAPVFPVPLDGRGLNPLLEDANMLTHPPLLYAGFVGLTVPYAFAMAALITGKLDEAWILTTRRWTITAWFFLTLGNLVGAWWSYHVLGWGGYWAWDPVENAAFMPWLPATAFLHSIQIQERRRMLKTWNLALIIIAFSLTIFGTFLTRSGILSSIHAFSSGPVGMLFLGFLAVVVLGSFGLLAWRADRLRGQPELDAVVSRESIFLRNNAVLVAALFTIFLGTIFPLLSEALAGVKVSVGAPFFNRITTPLFLILVFLMGVGPLIAWRKASLDHLRRNFLWPAALALAVGLALYAWRVRDFWPLLAVTYLGLILFHGGHADGALLAIERALAKDPNYPLALWAKGIVLFEGKQDYAGAIQAWETLMARTLAPRDADAVAQWITEARQRLAGQPAAPQQAANPGGTIAGTVTLAPQLSTEVPPGGALFLIARKGDGPPLAVKRIPDPTFPVSFALGPEDRMLAGTPFEGEVTLLARLKRNGTAGPPAPGDFEGRPAAPSIQVGHQGVEIVLDKAY